MQTLPFFCTISNQGFYFIFGAISPKSGPKKNGNNLPKGIFLKKTKIFARLYFFKSHIASMIAHIQTSVTRTNKDVKKCHLAKR
jgi:hypothetical protein